MDLIQSRNPSTPRRGSKVKHVKVRQVASPTERQATRLLREVFAVFENDHGQVLREVKEVSPENRERVLRVAPAVARRLDLQTRIQAFLSGLGGDA